MAIIKSIESNDLPLYSDKELLKIWEVLSKQKTKYCLALGCNNSNIDGARVKLANEDDGQVYLYPLCDQHRLSDRSIVVTSVFRLVPHDLNQVE